MNRFLVRSFQLIAFATGLTFFGLMPESQAYGIRVVQPDGGNSEALYHNGMQGLFDQLIQLGGNEVLRAAEGGQIIKLSQVRAKISTIRFEVRQGVLTSGDPNVFCQNEMESHWFTAADTGGRPLIARTQFTSVANFAAGDWSLYFHETLSALGIVDDEYQVSASLLALAEEARASRRSMQAIADDPSFKEFVAPLKAAQFRGRSPRYKLNKDDYCYSGVDSTGRLTPGGPKLASNTTGIGGGGNGASLALKTDLVRATRAWWLKNNRLAKPESDFTRFMKLVSDLGVEPLNNSRLQYRTFPVELEFRKSKRSGRLTVYALTDTLHEMKLKSPKSHVMVPNHRGEYTRFTQAEWCGAIDLILGHLYESI